MPGPDDRDDTVWKQGDAPLVDVGIPTRPETRYLSEAVDSVVAQTSPGWLLHVSINGESGGRAAEIMRGYEADPRVSYSITGAALTAGANYTRLIRHGRAPFVALLHDDDRWQPGYLETRCRYLSEHPRCGFVFSDATVIRGDGTPVGRTRLSLEPRIYEPEELLPLVYERNLVSVASVVVRRSSYEAAGAAYREDLLFNDHEMWIRLASRFQGGYIDLDDSEYRIHANATSAERRLRLAESSLHLLDVVDTEVHVPESLRRRVRARANIRCALDAVERSEPSRSLRHLVTAARLDLRACAAPAELGRIALAVFGIALGSRGRALIARVRVRRWALGGAEP
jgi:glycosyltransferase involved in cell wall biosynthesis